MELDFHTKSFRMTAAFVAFIVSLLTGLGFIAGLASTYTKGVEWVDGVGYNMKELSAALDGLRSQVRENTAILAEHGKIFAKVLPQVDRIEEKTRDPNDRVTDLGRKVDALGEQLTDLMRHPSPIRGGAIQGPTQEGSLDRAQSRQPY